jgi:hypothetical protein
MFLEHMLSTCPTGSFPNLFEIVSNLVNFEKVFKYVWLFERISSPIVE